MAIEQVNKALDSNQVIYVLIDPKDYQRNISEILKTCSKKFAEIESILFDEPKRIGVVLFSTPVSRIESELPKELISDRLFFIDCVTLAVSHPTGSEEYRYRNPKTDLGDLGKDLFDLLFDNKCGLLIVESPTNLLEYHDRMGVVRLVHDITTQVVSKNLSSVFIYPTEGFAKEIEKDVEMFADKIIEANK